MEALGLSTCCLYMDLASLQQGYGALPFNTRRRCRTLSLVASAALSPSHPKEQKPQRRSLSTKKKKTPTHESSSMTQSKPSKLMRTWNEGRKVLYTKTVPKPVSQEPKAAVIDRNGGAVTSEDSLDIFYSEDDDDQEEDDEREDGDHHSYLRSSIVDGAAHTEVNASLAPPTDLNCQHFKRCSGCSLDTALDEPPIFKDAQRFFCCHGIKDVKLTTGSLWEWRCKAKLAVRGTAMNPVVGLYMEGTHDVVDIPKCRTHHPRINAAVDLLKAGIRELVIQPYDEDSGKGELRYVQMSITTYNTSIPVGERYANGKVQVVLVWNDRSEQSSSGALLKSLSEFLWVKGGLKSSNPIVHSVWANFQTTRTNIIFGGRWRHLLGEQQCWERMGGVDVSLTPASFSQSNLQAFESLLRKLQKFVKPGKAVVELYAGSGIIGLSLLANCACRAVRCVEVNKEAKTSFDLSLSRFPGPNKSKISWHCADVTVSPINWLKGSDVVVVDPPRKGLDASVISALRTAASKGDGKVVSSSKQASEKVEKRPWILRAQQAGVEAAREFSTSESAWPDTLIYISCGWEAFKRDCTELVEGGAWHLSAGHAFHFFPGTDSIELLAIFKRGKKRTLKKKLLKNKGLKP